LAELRVASQIPANQLREFPASAELRDHPSLCQDLLELLRTIDWCDGGTVSHEVRIAVRDNDDVAGLEGYGRAVSLDSGIGPSVDDQVEDDDVRGTGGQV
jgi:hypothetical protein